MLEAGSYNPDSAGISAVVYLIIALRAQVMLGYSRCFTCSGKNIKIATHCCIAAQEIYKDGSHGKLKKQLQN